MAYTRAELLMNMKIETLLSRMNEEIDNLIILYQYIKEDIYKISKRLDNLEMSNK